MQQLPRLLCLALILPGSLMQAQAPRVQIETSRGNITVELDADKAPVSTLNFLRYTQAEFYDGTIFHRVMPNFMIQGGGLDPELDKKEEGLMPPIVNEWQNGLKNVRGTIAMARTSDPDSATAQFFINVVDNPSLDRGPGGGAGYAVFGRVVEGIDVVDRIRHTETVVHPKYPGGKVVPVETVLIESVRLQGEYDTAALDQVAARRAKELAEQKQLLASQQEIEAETFLKENAEKEGVVKTESGLQYKFIEAGGADARKPVPTDRIEVHYEGKLMNGRIFDSTYQRNQTVTFRLDQVIPGWQEGLQLLSEGGKIQLCIPPDLAYGVRGRPPVIPPNSPLIFEVELIRIHEPAEVPEGD